MVLCGSFELAHANSDHFEAHTMQSLSSKTEVVHMTSGFAAAVHLDVRGRIDWHATRLGILASVPTEWYDCHGTNPSVLAISQESCRASACEMARIAQGLMNDKCATVPVGPVRDCEALARLRLGS